MLATREIDYRIVYMKEQDFERKVQDVYIAKQTYYRPPFFIDILMELIDIEAALFMLHSRDEFEDLTEREYDDLYRKVEAEDPEAINYVYERMDKRFIECFARDLYLHLTSHQLAFLENDVYKEEEWVVHASPIQSVW